MHYLEYNESKQHGTHDFPIELYHIDESHSRYNMPYHWHQEYELIRILEGNLLIYLDNEEIHGLPGDVIFINAGVVHGCTPEDCIYECIVFDLEALLMHTDTCRQLIRPFSKQKKIVQNHFTSADTPFQQVIQQLFQTMQGQQPGYELATTGTLFLLFGCIVQNHYYHELSLLQNRGQKKMAQLKPVLEYIETSYAEPITLDTLSKIAGMSPKYFCRFFHAVVHATPMDYLIYYRIERACFLLTTQDISVTDVGFGCGFNDSSYFIKIFKKHKGMTPRQYALQVV
ncbi:MAG: AraC family transcriptional regulator [Lachnospiraceae bacterium]